MSGGLSGLHDSRKRHTAPLRSGARSTNAAKQVSPRIGTRKRGLATHPKLPMRETLALLRAIATTRSTIDDLTTVVRMSRATIYRLLSRCRSDLCMRIDCESRVLRLRDWGLLNSRKVLKLTRQI